MHSIDEPLGVVSGGLPEGCDKWVSICEQDAVHDALTDHAQ